MTTSTNTTSSQSRLQCSDGADISKPAVLQRPPKKKALLIGINYGSPNQGGGEHELDGDMPQLNGPHKDVEDMKRLLIDKYQYRSEDIVVLLDDGRAKSPTHANIIEEMEALVKDVKSGDHLLFHYAGHGGQKKAEDNEKDEDDGMNEAIIPCDATHEDESKWILDNDLNTILVKSLGTVDCRLVAIFDMCHAGTALDLKHYECNRVYVPFITKSRRWTRFQRYRAQRRRDGTFVKNIGEETHLNNVSSVRAHQANISSIPSRASTHPVYPGGVRSNARNSYAGQTNVTGEVPQGVVLSGRTAYRSFAQADCEIASRPNIDKTMPNEHQTPQLERKKLRVITKKSSSRKQPTTHVTIPEEVENVTANVANDSNSPNALCGCLPLINSLNTPFAIKWPWKLLRRLKGDLQSDEPPVSERRASKTGAETALLPQSNGNVHYGSTQSARPCSLGGCCQVPNGRSSISSDALVVDSPMSASPILTQMPEVKFDPCLVGHGPEHETPGPFVISLSACADGQSAFEDARGKSMTAALVEILEDNPNPSYRQLMTGMSHRLYETAQRLHSYFRKRDARQKAKKNHEAKNDREAYIDSVQDSVLRSEPIQEPILGSERKLDLDNDLFVL